MITQVVFIEINRVTDYLDHFENYCKNIMFFTTLSKANKDKQRILQPFYLGKALFYTLIFFEMQKNASNFRRFLVK